MIAWLDAAAEQLHIGDPAFALCLGLMLVLFLVISAARFLDPKLPANPASQRIARMIDESSESARPLNASLAQQGLGTSSLVNSVIALQTPLYEAARKPRVGLQVNWFCGDSIVTAAFEQDLDPSNANQAYTQIRFTGPDPFLNAAHAAAADNNSTQLFIYGPAVPESILLSALLCGGCVPTGGAPAPLSGLLLSETPHDAVFGEDYYTVLLKPSTSVRVLRMHKMLRYLILIGVLVGMILMYLGAR